MRTSPLLTTPDPANVTMSDQRQPMALLVDADIADGSPISAGWVQMRPGGVAEPHHHPNTWVYILLWSAGPLGAITLYGPKLEHRIHQQPGQLLLIPPGVPHAAVNPSPSHHVVAYEFRGAPSIHTDNIVLDNLRPHLDGQVPVLFDPPPTPARR